MIIKTKRGTNQYAQRGYMANGWVCKNGHINETKYVCDPFPRMIDTDFCQRKGCKVKREKSK